jgi:uncharacterized protein
VTVPDLSLLAGAYAVCRLGPDSQIPAWANRGAFVSITRTDEELSIVCPQVDVPENVASGKGWKCLRVDGTLDFSVTGLLASLLVPLARADISVLAIATFGTDYLLVREEQLEQAVRLLSSGGHRIRLTDDSKHMR